MKRWKQLAAAGALAAVITGAFIPEWEGTQNRAYWDAAGQVWTICSGHTRGVKAGDVATDDQCATFLREDMAEADAAVSRCIRVPLKERERAAFSSAAFNLGPDVVCGSTLQARANAGDVPGACLQLTDALNKRGNVKGWTYAGGVESAGARNRRTAERNLCLGYFK